MANSLYQQCGLSIGGTYTRKKIVIALCKLYGASKVYDGSIERMVQRGFLRLENPSPMARNFDVFTILKDFRI